MFGQILRRKPNLDSVLTSLFETAAALGDEVISCAPTDRAVSVAELRSVENLVLATAMSDLRATWTKEGISSSAIEMFAVPIERKFRAAFAERFYANAPLARVADGGNA